MNRIKLIVALLCMAALAHAQTAPPADLASIEQNFKKLEVLGSVLYVAAHPDDENTRLLAYLAQEKHYRTGYLSMTRGDGGQNLIGNEQSELLGLIRTQELLAARRVDGAEQFFTRANDFGFSKGPGETLKIWDKEKVLSDVVWVIRKFRPDVIICRFPTTGEGGHGHHTSSAILAQEAFTAAADPARYPEQLSYVQPWQAKRLLWNTFNFGGANTTAPDQFKINVGVYNPILGKGYGELAAESRSNHKTQGFGTARQRGEAYEYFKTILGQAPQNDLMDGVNTTWGRLTGGREIGTAISAIRKNFDIDEPNKSVPALVALVDKLDNLQDAYWKKQKTNELNDLIAGCAGLWFESYSPVPSYALGDTIQIRSQVALRYSDQVKLNALGAGQTASDFKPQIIAANQAQTFSSTIVADHITQPYWLAATHSQGTYNVANQGSIGNPENNDLPAVAYEFIIAGKPIHFQRRVVYKYTDPVRGEVYQPLVITPPAVANIASPVYIFKSDEPQTIQVKLKLFKDIKQGALSLLVPKQWSAEPALIRLNNKKKGEEWTVSFSVRRQSAAAQNGPATLFFTHDFDNSAYSYGIKEINYNHIPNITLFPRAEVKLINIDLKITGKKIGYLDGAGDLVADALKQIGYEVHELSENELLNGNLAVYDAIVTGVRAYNVNPRLAVEQPKLLEYVKNGGNLLIQYNNNSGLVTRQIGPYPFSVVNRRVTDEDAKITVLDPENPVLNYPNKITQDDFAGWIQERGLYFVSDIDSQYKAVLQMSDPGETPNNGALITGNYGKGRFVYTSLAFFRQLPAGVPGAYRLFVNLLSKPAN